MEFSREIIMGVNGGGGIVRIATRGLNLGKTGT